MAVTKPDWWIGKLLFLAELFFHLLKADSLGLWNHDAHPNELQDHHEGKEAKDRGGETSVVETVRGLPLSSLRELVTRASFKR